MELRNRLYPYPVLSPFTDDYINSSFETIVDLERVEYSLRVHMWSELRNDELKTLLESDKVKYVYHVECPQTGYRTAVASNTEETFHEIADNKVRGQLQVCSFIVANDNFSDYSNACLHEDYSGFTFEIDAGCIMAVGSQVNFEIEKDLNDLSFAPSVILICKNLDEDTKGVIVDMNHSKLIIKIPEKAYYNYVSLTKEIEAKSILRSMIIIPAIAHALQEVAKRDPQSRFEFSRYSWYLALKKNLLEVFACDIESDTFVDQDMLNLAQKIINNPLDGALEILARDFGAIEGDYEE